MSKKLRIMVTLAAMILMTFSGLFMPANAEQKYEYGGEYKMA